MGEVAATPSRRFPRWLIWALRLLVMAALVAYILHGLDFREVGRSMLRIPGWALLAGMVLLWTGQSLQALRWKVLLRDPSVKWRECLAYICVGASLNLVSPSGILSDGTVSYWMGRRNQTVLKSMSTLLASRFIGVASMALLLLIALPGHLWVFDKLTFGWAPAKALAIGAFLAALAVAGYLARGQKERILRVVHQALPSLQSPPHLAIAVVLSFGVQFALFAKMMLGYHVLGIPIGLLDLFFFAPIMTFLGLVPMSIGGIGVREGLSIFFFTMIPGVEKEALLAHAGYGYLLMLGMAAVNLLFAFAVLGRPDGKGGAGPITT